MSSNLGAAADARKARLAQLRNLKRKLPADEVAAPESNRTSPLDTPSASGSTIPDVAALRLSGRNYDAATRGPKLGFENAPNEALDGPTLEEKAAEIAAQVRETAQKDAQESAASIDLFKLQPKKPNWDLKRDLDKRLETLNVKTDNAISRLVRKRIMESSNAARGKSKGTAAEGDQETMIMDGTELVEGLRVREQEIEEERRERAELDA
ncbi:hypothetical protein Cpir12675_005492 [Ceratocystis pirilliformis]|uniref:Pre-mRNA-splicing factor cwf18 n=1 Tax=Ceratocystis pirilliformis TaxID=259994 RepID=A0ABR3YPB1_9PEZI